MSRPFPYPALKKEDQYFNLFIRNVLDSCVDLHRSVAEFQLVETPTTSSDSGTPGMVSYDTSYLYICVDDNTWKRVALSTW